MESRTAAEEIAYTQALGYAWGYADALKHNGIVRNVSSIAFANWYAAFPSGKRPTLEEAHRDFSRLPWNQQASVGDYHVKLPHGIPPTRVSLSKGSTA
jgi:hypothetical protein